MAPKVKVPADFGVHHMGSVAHGNLLLKLKDNETTRANSMILSLNSPVIDDLTTNLHQSSLDVDDFDTAAVDTFIEACYTGEVENICKNTFRDLNKLAHAFRVYWLISRCFEYFRTISEQIDDFEDMCYIFDEAEYVYLTLKKRNFINLAIQKICFLEMKKNTFIMKYIQDFHLRSENQLKLAVELTGNNFYMLANALTACLKENGTGIDNKSRYLLKSINFNTLIKKNDSYSELIQLLENMDNLSMPDMKMVLALHKNSSSYSAPWSNHNIPNIHCSFEAFKGLDFEDLIANLTESCDVKSLYMFVEAIFFWLLNGNIPDTSLPLTFTDSLEERIRDIMIYKGWSPMFKKLPRRFATFVVDNNDTGDSTSLDEMSYENKFRLMLSCSKLLRSNVGKYRIPCTENVTTESLELESNETTRIKFHFQHPSTTECTKDGHCGFILTISSSSYLSKKRNFSDMLGEDSPSERNDKTVFDFQLCTDPDEYPKDLHFHSNLIFAANMHLMIEDTKQNLDDPLSWNGNLEYDRANKIWRWGMYGFCTDEEEPEVTCKLSRLSGKFYMLSNEIKFVVFYSVQ